MAWEKVKSSENPETKENKTLFREKTENDGSFNKFKIEWNWGDSKKQFKIVRGKELALRFYRCIDISNEAIEEMEGIEEIEDPAA